MSNKIEMIFNGDAMKITAETSIATFLKQQAMTSGHFIVAVNGELVLKSHYEHTLIQAQDKLDTITAITGG